MKIRIMGTMAEINAAQGYYLSLRGRPDVESVEVSRPYANRAPSELYRLYIDVVYRQGGGYQQRYGAAEPWADVSAFGVQSALTCNGQEWRPIAAKLAAGEIVKTEFAEYRQLKGGAV